MLITGPTVGPRGRDEEKWMAPVTVGIDWAEGHHDVAVMEEAGAVVGKTRIDTGVAGFTELLGRVRWSV